MGIKLKLILCAIGVVVLTGCAKDDKDEKAFLDAPASKSAPEAQSQKERGISPEMAKKMAEPGLDGKR